MTSPSPLTGAASGARSRFSSLRLGRDVLTTGLRDSAGLLLLAQGATAVVALLANIMASRSLLADGRGELALLLQIAYLGTLGVTLGTDRSLVAVYGGLPVHQVVRAQVRLLVRPSVVALCLGLAGDLALPLVGLGRWRLAGLVVGLFIISNAFVRASRAVAIAGDRQHDFVIATIVEQLLLIVALAALALSGVDSVIVWITAYLVTAIGPVVFYLIRWGRTGSPDSDDAPRRREARREGLQLVPSSLANTGMLRLDRLLLVPMASTAALGHYASVSTFTELITWPLLAFADNRTGVWRRRHDTGHLRSRTILLGAMVFVISGSLITAGLTWSLVPLLGPGFEDVHALIPPLVAAAGVLGLSQVVMSLLVARRRNTWASASDMGGFAVSLAAYLTLIPRHGAAGAAWGSLIGYSAALIIGGTALALAGRFDRFTAWRASRPRKAPQQPVRAFIRPTPGGTWLGEGALAGATLMVVMISGRFTLDRAGFAELAWVDLRVVGLAVACGLILVDLRLCGGLKGHQPAGWIVAAMLFFGYQGLSIGWAPAGAQLASGAIDLACLAVLVFAVYLHARTWPERAGWRVMWLFWVSGVVFGLGAFLVTGPGEQGRYAAFGGGPNVFVRIEVLGLIAVFALVIHGASKHLLWSVPLLFAGALASGSRGGLLAAGMVAGAAVLAGRRQARRVALVAATGALGVLILIYRLGLPGAGLIRTRFVEQTLQEGYVSDRPTIYVSAVDLAREHALLGVGLDGWRVLIGDQLGIVYPHNYLLAIAAEGGVIGLVLFGTAVGLWLRHMMKARPWSLLTKSLVGATAFITLASMTSGDYYDSRLAWCCCALAAACCERGSSGRSTAPPGRVSYASPPQHSSLGTSHAHPTRRTTAQGWSDPWWRESRATRGRLWLSRRSGGDN
jgi:O-antigen/teichoic acid export membrane protein/O-antigen ligase